jgi:alkylation response protein AidB-like acyl-CoA dehydrogenase
LESGTVTWEGDIFSGHPNFEKLWSMPVVELTEEEQAFIEGPVNTLCRLINDWEISHERGDLSPELWRFIKENRFLGMLSPKEYGGLEFSATKGLYQEQLLQLCRTNLRVCKHFINTLLHLVHHWHQRRGVLQLIFG